MSVQRAHGHERKRLAAGPVTATTPITLEEHRRMMDRLTVTCSFCRRGDCGECRTPGCGCKHPGWEPVAKVPAKPKAARVKASPKPARPKAAKAKREPAPVKAPRMVVVRSKLTKDTAPCCQAATVDGRPPIGLCGPECLRRPRLVAV